MDCSTPVFSVHHQLLELAQPTPVLLPGKSHGQRNLVGYSPWGHIESDTAERLSMHAYICPLFFGFPSHSGFPGGSAGKVSACNAGDLGLIPGSGRSPGEGNGIPLQYPCLEKSHGWRSLVGYSHQGFKKSDTIKQLLSPIQVIREHQVESPLLCLIDFVSKINLESNNFFPFPQSVQRLYHAQAEPYNCLFSGL